MEAASANSDLLRLPAELRLQIYELVIGRRTLHIGGIKPFGNPGTASCHATPCMADISDARIVGLYAQGDDQILSAATVEAWEERTKDYILHTAECSVDGF